MGQPLPGGGQVSDPVVEAEAARDGGVVRDKEAGGGTDIVVTGARTVLPLTALPLTADVLGGEALDRQVAVSGSVVEALSARFPSFSPTREKLTGAGESLRGRSALFAINGVPQSTPIRDGSRDGYTIDPFFIDRVEIIYGSNALQGIGGTGGVVNQVTVDAPAEAGWHARILVQGSAQDGLDGATLGGKVAAFVGRRSGRITALGGASFQRRGVHLDGGGRLIGVDTTQGETQDSDSWSLFGRLGYELGSNARIEIIANRFELKGRGNYVAVRGIPTVSRRGETDGRAAAARAELVSASFAGRLAGGQLNLQGFFSRTRDIFGGSITGTFQDPAIAPPGTLFDQSVNRSRKTGFKLSYERTLPGFDALTLAAGFDLLDDRTAQGLLLTGRTWVPETTFRSRSPFLQGNLGLVAGTLRLVGGLRREEVELVVPDFTTLAFYGSRAVAGGRPRFSRTLANVGTVLEPAKGLRAYASYSQGYTIPDVGRILRAINVNGTDVDSFLALEPIVSNNRELGIEWRRGPLTASASHWWSSSKLGALLVRNSGGVFDVVRQPVRLRGLDLSAELRTPVDGVSVGFSYAWIRGRTAGGADGRIDDDLDGANIGPNRLNLQASMERGRWDGRLAIRHHSARRFNDPGSASDFDGYTLVDASAGMRIAGHRLSFSVSNLFDKDYLAYNSDTAEAGDPLRSFNGRGRTFTLGLSTNL